MVSERSLEDKPKTLKTGRATLHIDVVIDCVDINDFKIQVCQLNLVRQAERRTPG